MIKDKELRSSDYKAILSEIANAEARLREISELKANGIAELARIKRLKAAQPLIRQIDAEIERLEGFRALPQISNLTLRELETALDQHDAAIRDLEKSRLEEREIELEYDGIRVDDALVAQSARIDGLYSRVEAYRLALRDRPRVQAEAAKLEADLADLAMRLGCEPGEGLAQARPTDAELARVQELMDQGRTLLERLAATRDTLSSEEAALKSHLGRRAQTDAPVDPTPFRSRLAALKPDLKKVESGRAAAETLARDGRTLREEAARLRPSIDDLEALAAAPLPSGEMIERYRSILEELAARSAQETDRVRSCEAGVDHLRAQLTALRHERAVPTREQLDAARMQRGEAWSVIRSVLFGERALQPEKVAEGVYRFEQLVSDADRLADDIAADAERVFAIAELDRRLEQETARGAELARGLEEIESARASRLVEWEELWSPVGVVPLEPRDMKSWRTAVASLLERRDALRARQDEQVIIEEQGRTLLVPLNGLANELRLAPYEGADVLIMARYVEDAIEAMARNWAEAREDEALLAEAHRRIGDLQQAREQGERALAEWRARFDTAVAAIGLKPGASLAEAAAASSGWQRLPGLQKELDSLRKRVRGMERDTIGPFESEARAVVADLAPDLASLPLDSAVKELQSRVGEAKKARVLREDLAMRLTRARAKVRTAGEVRGRAQNAVAEMASAMGQPAAADLRSLIADIKARSEIEASLRGLRQQLGAATEQHDEAELRAALVDFDADRAEAEFVRLTEANAQLDQEGREIYAAKDRQQTRLAEIEGGVGAEEAHQMRHVAEAQILETAREYLVLKLGALLIGAALTRHRANNQSPLMTRAGILFNALTAGAFTGLEQAIGDDNGPRLLARRASGTTLALGEMSEGTVDQLYLALRLAYLQDYASRAEPVPFIGDDLFATFDDERAGHGLETLASFSRAAQPILFTHHFHIVEIARKRLGSKVDVVDLSEVQLAAPARVALAG
jgi:Arc/MetJ family transcription regulator